MLDDPDGGKPTPLVGAIAPATDDDPWKDVAKQVAAGDLVFDPIAAQTAAEECAEAISRILGVQKKIATDTDDLNLTALSQLASGGMLATQFNNTLDGLNDVLGSHKAVLTRMLDAFKEAGKKYIDTELDSAWGFDKQTREDMKKDFDRVKVKPADGTEGFSKKAPKATGLKAPKTHLQKEDEPDLWGTRNMKVNPDDGIPIRPEELVRPATISDKMAEYLGSNQTQPAALEQWRLELGANTENPESQSWGDLYELGETTKKATTPVIYVGKMWKWMADEIDEAVGGFAERLAKMPDSLWKGEGADTAIGAVKNYHGKSTDLTKRMQSFGANLDYTAQWLANTHKGMPTDRTPPKFEGEDNDYWSSDIQKSVNRRNLAIYRQNMENNYVPGVQGSSQFVPALTELPSPPTDKPDGKPGGDDKKTAKDGAAGPGGTGPGGTGPGGISPSISGGGLSPSIGGGTAPSISGIDPYAASRSLMATPVDYDTSGIDPTQVGGGANDPALTSPAASGADGLGQLAGLAQQGLSGVGSAAQQAAQAAAQDAAMRSMPNIPGLGDLARSGAPSGPGGARGGGAGVGGGGSSPAAPSIRAESEAARLFPRASLAGPAASSAARMGMPASGMPMGGGTPGSPGSGAGGNQGQQNKDHKRPAGLNSKEHLEEAMGEARTVTKAVVEK
ncbi:hypothetical protein [Nocardia sp. NBC_00416]|uniref:hypothetical protein n=1 Tax=Nocardia sp. NBC_00416 TaxID=2975991 RepID=UPI002E1F42F8